MVGVYAKLSRPHYNIGGRFIISIIVAVKAVKHTVMILTLSYYSSVLFFDIKNPPCLFTLIFQTLIQLCAYNLPTGRCSTFAVVHQNLK